MASRFEAFIKLAFGLRSAAQFAGPRANHANRVSWLYLNPNFGQKVDKGAKMVGFSAVSEGPFGIPF